MGDDALAEFMGRYMSTALELYLAAQRTGASALTAVQPVRGDAVRLRANALATA